MPQSRYLLRNHNLLAYKPFRGNLMVNRLISKARSGHLSTTCCCAK